MNQQVNPGTTNERAETKTKQGKIQYAQEKNVYIYTVPIPLYIYMYPYYYYYTQKLLRAKRCLLQPPVPRRCGLAWAMAPGNTKTTNG